MKLTFWQKKQLYQHGFVKLTGVVPKVMTDDALRAINHQADWKAPMTDIWMHWPGIREVDNWHE